MVTAKASEQVRIEQIGGSLTMAGFLWTQAVSERARLSEENTSLTARLAAAEAQHEADAKLLAEHARTVRRYIARYEQERQDRQKAESRQYSVGAEHLREYAARVKERDEARQQSENYRTEYLCLFVTNPCGHLGRFMEQGAGCMKCKLAAAEAALQRLMDVQNGPPLIRDKQEWNEAMAEACGVLRNANAMQFYLTAANGGRDE